MILESLWIAAGLALAATGLYNHRKLLKALAPRPLPPRLESYPSVTVIRPIKDLDPEADENTRFALRHGYPGRVQTIFVFDDDSDPTYPIVKRVIEEHDEDRDPGSVEILFCGEPKGRTGKLNAMECGLARAQGDLVAFVDSDVRWDREALRVAVECIAADPKAGSASSPVVVSPAPRTLWDACSALLLNGLYGSAARQVTMQQGGELSFILGQLMVFRREALHAIGNLSDIAGNFVDDIQIGLQVSRAGFKNVVSPQSIEVIWFGYGWNDFVQNFVRWMTFSRGFDDWSFPRPIAWRASVFFAGFIGGVAFAANAHWLASATWFLAAAVSSASLVLLHERMGGAKLRGRYWFSPVLLLLVIPFIFARVYTQRSVTWRGRTYRLDGTGRLADRAR